MAFVKTIRIHARDCHGELTAINTDTSTRCSEITAGDSNVRVCDRGMWECSASGIYRLDIFFSFQRKKLRYQRLLEEGQSLDNYSVEACNNIIFPSLFRSLIRLMVTLSRFAILGNSSINSVG